MRKAGSNPDPLPAPGLGGFPAVSTGPPGKGRGLGLQLQESLAKTGSLKY